MYRLLSDFYPKRGTPQLIESTVVVSGGPIAAGTSLIPDLAPKRSANLEASLTLEPTRPIAGLKIGFTSQPAGYSQDQIVALLAPLGGLIASTAFNNTNPYAVQSPGGFTPA